MAKPDNPGQGNGNQGNGNPGSVVVVELVDGSMERFDGFSSYRVEGGCILVGDDAIASGQWARAWLEPDDAPEPEP